MSNVKFLSLQSLALVQDILTCILGYLSHSSTFIYFFIFAVPGIEPRASLC
jgi:hypothetical protein